MRGEPGWEEAGDRETGEKDGDDAPGPEPCSRSAAARRVSEEGRARCCRGSRLTLPLMLLVGAPAAVPIRRQVREGDCG